MKKTIAALIAACAIPAFAQSEHWVQPHYTRDGTYVQGHMQTNPDATRMNNWSTQGNVNPYTGQAGTVNPYAQPQPYQQVNPYQQQRQQSCGYNAYGQYVCR